VERVSGYEDQIAGPNLFDFFTHPEVHVTVYDNKHFIVVLLRVK